MSDKKVFTEPRGVCPFCESIFALRKDGTIRTHVHCDIGWSQRYEPKKMIIAPMIQRGSRWR